MLTLFHLQKKSCRQTSLFQKLKHLHAILIHQQEELIKLTNAGVSEDAILLMMEKK